MKETTDISQEKQSFLTGAFILTIAGLISQVIGVFSKIFLLWLIGEEGVGIYNFPYPFFAIILSFSSIGFNVAISKLVAEYMAYHDIYHARRVFRLGMRLSLALGIVGMLLLLIMAYPMARFVHQDMRALLSYCVLAPTAFLTSFQAVYRGYFQGLQNMKPNAYSQIIEQCFRVIVMLGAAWILLPYGLQFAAAGATLGGAGGAIAASLFLRYLFDKTRRLTPVKVKPLQKISDKKLIRRILSYAVPISLAGIGLPLFLLSDSLLIANRLQAAGATLSVATAAYGVFANNAMSLITLPTILTSSLFVTLVPAIAEARALNDQKRMQGQVQGGMKLTLLFALPAAAGMWMVAPALCTVLRMGSSTADALRTLTFGLIFIALQQVSSGILQGMGYSTQPVRHMFFGAAVKCLCNWFLIPIFGLHGAAIGTAVGFMAAALLNLWQVKNQIGNFIEWKTMFFKPLLSTAAMLLTLACLQRIIWQQNAGASLSLLVQAVFGVAVYALFLLLSKAVTKDDLNLLRKKQ